MCNSQNVVSAPKNWLTCGFLVSDIPTDWETLEEVPFIPLEMGWNIQGSVSWSCRKDALWQTAFHFTFALEQGVCLALVHYTGNEQGKNSVAFHHRLKKIGPQPLIGLFWTLGWWLTSASLNLWVFFGKWLRCLPLLWLVFSLCREAWRIQNETQCPSNVLSIYPGTKD